MLNHGDDIGLVPHFMLVSSVTSIEEVEEEEEEEKKKKKMMIMKCTKNPKNKTKVLEGNRIIH